MAGFVPEQHPRGKAGLFVAKPARVPTAAPDIVKPSVEHVLIPANEKNLDIEYMNALYLEECFDGSNVAPGSLFIVCSKDTDSFYRDVVEAENAAYKLEEAFGHLGEGYHPEVYSRVVGPWSANWDLEESSDLEYVYWVTYSNVSQKFDSRDAAANYAIDVDEQYSSLGEDYLPWIKRRAMTKWCEHFVGGETR